MKVSCVALCCVYLVFVKHDELTIETAVLQVRVAMDVPTLTAAISSWIC